MPRYYFDMREGDEIAPDEEGMELDTLEEVQEEAARTLADMAKDGIRGGRTDLAPKFYPILSLSQLLELPGWAVVATGAGAEPPA